MAATAVETGVKPLLDIQTPTPADIVIAQSVKPKHISQIAEVKLGLGPDDYELQGPTKAKVGASEEPPAPLMRRWSTWARAVRAWCPMAPRTHRLGRCAECQSTLSPA